MQTGCCGKVYCILDICTELFPRACSAILFLRRRGIFFYDQPLVLNFREEGRGNIVQRVI